MSDTLRNLDDNGSADGAIEVDDMSDVDESPLLLPVRFIDDFKRLPAAAPEHHAHIVDLISYIPDDVDEEFDIKIQDAVVTMLFNISKETLEQFLDSHVKTFKFIHFREPHMDNVLVWRKGSEVLVAVYETCWNPKIFALDNLIRLTIHFDGTWVLKKASWSLWARQDLEDVWAGKYMENTMWKAGTAYDEESKLERARMMAYHVLNDRCWEAEAAGKWTIKTTLGWS